MHKDLLRLRREEPALVPRDKRWFDGAVLSEQAFLLRYFGEKDARRSTAVGEFGDGAAIQSAAGAALGRAAGDAVGSSLVERRFGVWRLRDARLGNARELEAARRGGSVARHRRKMQT